MALDTPTLLIAGGVAAIVLAVLWRMTARHLAVSRLVRCLRGDPQAIERARAASSLIDLGLRRAAKPVLRAIAAEADARVRLSVALGVARRQWEPSGPGRVARLRHWASDELTTQGQPIQELGPAVTRLSDMGGPRLPAPNGNGGPAPAEPPPAPPSVRDPALAAPATATTAWDPFEDSNVRQAAPPGGQSGP